MPKKFAVGVAERLKSILIGQDEAIDEIVPFVNMFTAGLAPEGRPVGIFALLGPTGSGKTKTVEALAKVLHGDDRRMLKIDCGEFQADHEVAKLIGAPPGYLGHRETAPMISQKKLGEVGSVNSNLSLVLFDEIEKAGESLRRLLLGILDKATLHLGNGENVNFENSMIFLTSNLGAVDMAKALQDSYGFAGVVQEQRDTSHKLLKGIGERAFKRKFSPEFVNRVDCTLTYKPLCREAMRNVLVLEIGAVAKLLYDRTDSHTKLEVSPEAFTWLLKHGFSKEFGARELKRILHRHILWPVAALMRDPGPTVVVSVGEDDSLEIAA